MPVPAAAAATRRRLGTASVAPVVAGWVPGGEEAGAVVSPGRADIRVLINTMALITSESPRIVVNCASRASNRPNHLGLCDLAHARRLRHEALWRGSKGAGGTGEFRRMR